MTPEEHDYVQRAIHAIEGPESDERAIGYLKNALSEEE